MRAPGRTGRSTATAVLGLLALAACGPEGGVRTSDGAVSGSVLAVSDVSGLPDVPDADGWVVAVPADRIPEVLELAGDGRTGDGLTADDLRYGGFVMSVEAAERLGGTVGEVDRRGRFRLAASGDVLVCRLVADRRTDVQGARGCVRTVLPTDGMVRLTTGEAGLQVETPER